MAVSYWGAAQPGRGTDVPGMNDLLTDCEARVAVAGWAVRAQRPEDLRSESPW